MVEKRDSVMSGYGVDYREIYQDSQKLKNYSFNFQNVNNVENYNRPKICIEKTKNDDINKVTLKKSNSMTLRILYASFLMIICLGLFTAFVDSLDMDSISILVEKMKSGVSTIIMEKRDFENNNS